jgi:hypothetical protein
MHAAPPFLFNGHIVILSEAKDLQANHTASFPMNSQAVILSEARDPPANYAVPFLVNNKAVILSEAKELIAILYCIGNIPETRLKKDHFVHDVS